MKKATGKHHKTVSGRFKDSKELGDFVLVSEGFPEFEAVCAEFKTEDFKQLNDRQRNDRINRILLDLIKRTDGPSFLLPAIIEYIDRVNREKIVDHYAFSSFELWLNQFSGLDTKENYWVRGHIAGKWIPREEYQLLFPIGMGKTYPGSHFVTAHGSPDLDTTVSAFWGWMDAFASRVSEGLHLWNVPGGPPASQIEISILFNQIFGENVFNYLAKTRSTLALSSFELLTQKGVIKKHVGESSFGIDRERSQNAIVLVDDMGYFLGDWRNFDAEGVRQIVMLLNNCLRWFENNLHVKLISLFGKENLSLKDLPDFIQSVFGTRIIDSQPAKEFTENQKNHVKDYLIKVLKVKNGLESTFEEFARAMKKLSIYEFQEFIDLVESLQKSPLFDRSGYLIENRPRIFHQLEQIITGLDKAIQSIRVYVERLEVCLNIKTQVFGYAPQVVSYRADVEEIRSKMNNYPYLTVTYSDRKGKMVPLGVVHASDIHRPVLGTVTLRDFCNREETKIPSYLEVISVIDHHKSALNTFSPPVAFITDSQSSNAMVAELAFRINDRYSAGGMHADEIEAQIKAVSKDLSSPRNKRTMQRLLQRQMALEDESTHFIHPQREFVEYLHFLYAILDDTDLLTKVTQRDVEIVASLLNRLKSLALKKEVEIISFDDLSKNGQFVQEAAQRILQNNDMYSLYRRIYLSKENSIEENIQLCVRGKPSNIFADTKEQNGCCRVGQTKLFRKNVPSFQKHADQLRVMWVEEARTFHREKNEVDLHLHMISTLASADDLYAGTRGKYTHKDELWIWIPTIEQAIEHLKSFLNAFRSSPQVIHNELEVEFLGENGKELEKIFSESFLPIPRKFASSKEKQLPIAVVRYKAGSINSRKGMISPYLPRLLT
ncbi:MAG TPA: hypothetical protein VLG49_06820 [Rhabdochlamydiaceae bacterium]|nr:hypothetical protein [Rhabdochlamydiaceae bacterium]